MNQRARIVFPSGAVIAQVVPDVRAKTLMPFIATQVRRLSTVYTDELLSYDGVARQGYAHRRVQHSANVYVDGDASTNTIEGFWSLTKNGIRGVYHAVGSKYLQSYLNEYAFRYNRRHSDEPMFVAVLDRILRPLGQSSAIPS